MAQVFGAYAAANKTQLHDIVPAAPGDRQAHRNRVDFAFAATQWMPPPDGASALDGVLVQAQEPARVTGGQEGGRGGGGRSVFVGMRPSGVSDAVVDVEECLLPSGCAAGIYADIRSWLLGVCVCVCVCVY